MELGEVCFHSEEGMQESISRMEARSKRGKMRRSLWDLEATYM